MAHQLWCIDFLTPPTPLIIPHRLPAFLESLMPLKNWCSIHARWSKSSLKHSIGFYGIFPSLKQNFIAYRSSKVSPRPDCMIFEIHQLRQSGFSSVDSNSSCSCSFEPEIIKIGQSSHKMYSNNIVNFQESTTNLNACTKKCLETYWMHHVHENILKYYTLNLFKEITIGFSHSLQMTLQSPAMFVLIGKCYCYLGFQLIFQELLTLIILFNNLSRDIPLRQWKWDDCYPLVWINSSEPSKNDR